MASHDVRDVLNLPADGAARPTKKQKTSAPRPNLKGLAREVQNLGGDTPILIVPDVPNFKKRRFGTRKPAARWEMQQFKNSARADSSLQLRHWRKQTDDTSRPRLPPDGQESGEKQSNVQEPPQELEDSGFAKFNVQVDVPQYSEDQYNSVLASSDWTKDETDYLMGLAREFDLRWPVIWDRYDYTPKQSESSSQGSGADATDPNTAVIPAPQPRSMETLKKRYYEVAAKMMAVQKPVQYMTQAEFALHEMMTNFNATTEAQRKKFAENILARSKEEAREEESLLVEVRRLINRLATLNRDRSMIHSLLDYPSTEQDINPYKSSHGLQTLLQNLMNVDKNKKRKSIMDGNGSNTPASAQTPAPTSSTPVTENRRSSVAPSAGHGHRDSIGGADKPERPAKKGAPAPERKKLSEQEERLYGVSHHDRLPSGPTFRYERINKMMSNKSIAQHNRIANTLFELDIPTRLNMPTQATVAEEEKLLNLINVFLDSRKVLDKLDAEVKLLRAKAEQQKAAKAQANGTDGTNDANGANGSNGADSTNANGTNNTQGANGAEEPTKSHGEQKGGDAKGSDENATSTNEAMPGVVIESINSDTANNTTNGSTNGTANGTSGDNSHEGSATPTKTDNVGDTAPSRQENGADDKGPRPGSSGGHKRSASVLSSTSDKSAKRQKKT
ncbi:hypothetical protein F4780DRAFT_574621 [Xylariomycetidae sp. FL0641]|nr:hypothetical protein F4780DRAFT_574621 [Xylariomycetidae sp. FL0641]